MQTLTLIVPFEVPEGQENAIISFNKEDFYEKRLERAT
jgi:hypothetical protein